MNEFNIINKFIKYNIYVYIYYIKYFIIIINIIY